MGYTEDYNLIKAGSNTTLGLVDEVLDNFEGIEGKILELLKLQIHKKIDDFYSIGFDSKEEQKEPLFYQYESEILKLYNKKTRNWNNNKSRI